MDGLEAPPSGTSDRSSSPDPPLKNPRLHRFAPSAAKRESVMMLGSIEHLQLRFSQVDIEHRDGAGAGVKGMQAEGNEENMPPPEIKERKERKPWKDVETTRTDPKEARREARSLVGNVRSLWALGLPSSPSMAFSLSPLSPVSLANPRHQRDARTTIVSTAEAIRRIRTLALSVAHPNSSGGRRISGSAALLQPKSRARASLSTPARPNSLPRAVTYAQAQQKKSSLGPLPDNQVDDVARLRRAALEVLGGLRNLEERLRIEPATESGTNDASRTLQIAVSGEEGSDVTAVESGSNRATSTSYTEPDSFESEEEEYNLNGLANGEKEHHVTWEEKIVMEARQYNSLEGEEARVDAMRESIRKWVGVVETVFGVKERLTEDELESWVKEETWEGWSMERAHAFLLAHLPLNLQLLIPNTRVENFRHVFLARLSDGFLLAHALNAVLLSSSKAWGFIAEDDIHDTISTEAGRSGSTTPDPNEETKKDRSWTFMRTGNLTSWAAALRHRYNLPIFMPNVHSNFLNVPNSMPSPNDSPSPTLVPATTFGSPLPPDQRSGPQKRKESWVRENAPRIDFDPVGVAKHGEGWETMLANLLKIWTEEAAREVREDVEAEMEDS